MNNLSPELLKKLQRAFSNKFGEDKRIEQLNKLLFEKKATYKQANELSIKLGEILSEVYQENLSSESLPDGKMEYELAREIIEPTMKQNYELISEYSRIVQERLNELSGTSIRGIKAPINQDRIDGIVKRIGREDNFDKIKWILKEPIINYSQSIVDDTIKTNADFQARAGLKPRIVRRESGNCCDWCREVIGIYQYPDEVPDDVYKRHRYCRCTVEFLPGDGRKQDVWSKEWKGLQENDIIKENIEYKLTNEDTDKKLEKYRKEIKKTQRKLHKSLVGKEINGIEIKSISIHAAEQAVARNVTVKEISDTIKKPLKINEIKYDAFNRPSFGIVGKTSTVYMNPESGIMISTHKTHSKLAKKLEEKSYENNSEPRG